MFWAGLAGAEEEGNSDSAISFSTLVGLVISVRGMNKKGSGEDLSWQREEGGGGDFVRGVSWKMVARSGRNGWGLGTTTASSGAVLRSVPSAKMACVQPRPGASLRKQIHNLICILQTQLPFSDPYEHGNQR